MELFSFESLSGKDQARVYLGFMWRGLLTGIGSMLAGGIAGGLVGICIGLAVAFNRLPATAHNDLSWLTIGVGMCVGLVFLWIYVEWLFRSRIGGFELRLVKVRSESQPVAGVGYSAPQVSKSS